MSRNNHFVKVDSHAHLSSDELYPDAEAIVERARDAGVVRIVNINTDAKTLERGLLLGEKYSGFIFNTAATTPHDVEREDLLTLVREEAKKGKLVAIGETGLDYHYEHSPRQLQKEFLAKYIATAEEMRLPVVIHCREAFQDLFTYKIPSAVLHCFTGTLEEAENAIARGWYISFSGIVTFKKSTSLREVVKAVPLTRILIETDAPYLAPETKRGKINEPGFVGEIAETIAVIKGISLKEVCEVTTKNSCEFFRI